MPQQAVTGPTQHGLKQNREHKQRSKADHETGYAPQQTLRWCLPLQAFKPQLGHLKMDDIEKRDLGNQCQQGGMLYQLEIGHAGKFGNQKRSRPHHRRVS